MRLLQIRARSDEDVQCLVRDLAVYSPQRLCRSVLIELEHRSEAELLGLLAAIETCLPATTFPTCALSWTAALT
jgi:hypothetical protein